MVWNSKELSVEPNALDNMAIQERLAQRSEMDELEELNSKYLTFISFWT